MKMKSDFKKLEIILVFFCCCNLTIDCINNFKGYSKFLIFS